MAFAEHPVPGFCVPRWMLVVLGLVMAAEVEAGAGLGAMADQPVITGRETTWLCKRDNWVAARK